MHRKTGRAALGLIGLLSLTVASVGCLECQSRRICAPPYYSGQPYQRFMEQMAPGPMMAAPAMPAPMMPGPVMTGPAPCAPMVPNLPTEKEKVTFPEYVIEIPDVLAIEIMRAIPKGPHLVQPTDCLSVNCPQALREEPINGVYLVSANGRVNLGSHYGTVQVADLTQEQAQDAIRKHLATIVTNPTVTASLAIDGSLQQVCGRQAVASDGTIRLGVYGGVYVCGLTLDQARVAIENQLSNYLVRPEVSINVAASRSKFYYVIADTGCGEQIFRFMATGNETVLDALSMINGVTVPCPTRRVWVARPAPPTCGMPDQILPVDWLAITRAGNTRTNYQLLPGDRVYVLGLPNAPFVPPAGWMAGIPH